jgi:hypothetical protein
MLHAYLVDDPNLNSPQFLKLVSFEDETDIPGKALAVVNAFNGQKVTSRAGGALLWFDDRPDRLQFAAEDQSLRERLGEVRNLHGSISCMSGRTYKFYGRCCGWIPGGRAYWTAWLYAEDKKFVYDDVRTSKDQLAKFEGELFNMPIDSGTLKTVSDDAVRNAIEEWDSKREPQ